MTKVLIVEDEYLIAEGLKSSLESLGYEITAQAPSCSSALESIWANRPDIALVDTQLGSETCETVLNECAALGIPVIVTTGHITAPEFCAGLPVLAKPYGDDALQGALERWAPPTADGKE